MDDIQVNQEDGNVDQSDPDDEMEWWSDGMLAARERAFDAICESVQANLPQVTSVECDPHHFLDDDSATQLGRALVGNTHVNHLSLFLGPYATQAGCDELVTGIRGSQVESLHLRGRWEWNLPLDLARLLDNIKSLFLDFWVDDTYTHSLAAAMTLTSSTTTLESLRMTITYISVDGLQVLSAALGCSRLRSLTATGIFGAFSIQDFCDAIRSSHTIEELTISGNMNGVGGLTLFVRQLSKLFISGFIESPRITDMESLAVGIRSSTAMKEFKLTGGSDDNLRALLPILASHESLLYAELSDNQLGDDGLSPFVENWRNSVINELHLAQNNIGLKGLKLLLKGVANQPQLQKLNLQANTSIGYEGLELVGNALSGLNVKELNICRISKYTEFADDACEDAVLQEELRTKARQALLAGVRNNCCLRKLNVKCNKLGRSVQAEVDLYMEANGKGRRHFLVEQHAVPAALWGDFLARMSPSLAFLFLRELPTVVTMGHVQV